MTEIVAENHGIHQERAVHVHVLFPVNVLDHFIHFIGIRSLKFFDRLQDFYCCACAEISFVKHFLVACESHHSSANFNIIGT